MIRSIVKRDGRVVLYDETKIASAILKALTAAGNEDARAAAAVANAVGARLDARTNPEPPTVEEIQDMVENELMAAGHSEAAKKYILYRAARTRVRETNTSLMKTFAEITHEDARASDLKRDNANVDGNTAMGTMLKYGSEGAKQFCEMFILDTEHSRAHREGDIHIHDMDFYT